mmetsp:Transcript_36037/g.55341  ORF Transcript_36037/g.55341 Transcript_36037/m.55341 type:complete len:117 (+) Transcript_36037:25-375(+)
MGGSRKQYFKKSGLTTGRGPTQSALKKTTIEDSDQDYRSYIDINFGNKIESNSKANRNRNSAMMTGPVRSRSKHMKNSLTSEVFGTQPMIISDKSDRSLLGQMNKVRNSHRPYTSN